MQPKTEIPPRPARGTPEIRTAVAKNLLPRVLEWMGKEVAADCDQEELLEDLTKALQGDEDGYQMARQLEDYEPDAKLVEILDDAHYLVTEEYTKVIRTWVAEHTDELPRPKLYDIVTHPGRGGDHPGVVTHIYDDGRACVCFVGLGHVREGSGTRGFILPWEELVRDNTPT